MDDVHRVIGEDAGDGAAGRPVGGTEFAAHRHPRQAEGEERLQALEDRLGPVAAGRGVGDDADPVAARRLGTGQIDHVPEQPADR